MEFEADFGRKRWVEYNRGVFTIKPDDRTRPGEY